LTFVGEDSDVVEAAYYRSEPPFTQFFSSFFSSSSLVTALTAYCVSLDSGLTTVSFRLLPAG